MEQWSNETGNSEQCTISKMGLIDDGHLTSRRQLGSLSIPQMLSIADLMMPNILGVADNDPVLLRIINSHT